MDSSDSAREAADRLGLPVSTLLGWCREHRCDAFRNVRGHWRFEQGDVEALVRRHGAVPVPHPPTTTRQELLVLAALSRAPRGLPSARAVAVAAGLSPTTASRVLGGLVDADLVHWRTEPRAVRGRVRQIPVVYANLDAARLRQLLPYLQRVTLPAREFRLPKRLPDHLWHMFWNAEPADIAPERDAALIAHRAMTSKDPEAIAWAVRVLPPSAFRTALGYRGIDPAAVAWLRANVALRDADAAS